MARLLLNLLYFALFWHIVTTEHVVSKTFAVLLGADKLDTLSQFVAQSDHEGGFGHIEFVSSMPLRDSLFTVWRWIPPPNQGIQSLGGYSETGEAVTAVEALLQSDDAGNVRIIEIDTDVDVAGPRRLFLRAPSSVLDPLFDQQWHLVNKQSGGIDIGNLMTTWDTMSAGKGARIGIVDDGVEFTHPDLAANYDPSLSYDFNGRDSIPSADTPAERHATAVAGLCCASANNVCGRGVAFDAKFGSIRLLAAPITPLTEAAALTFENQGIDVYSSSWGPRDDGQTKDRLSLAVRAALEHGVAYGRGGKGSIYVFAAGNGRQNGDRSDCDAYASSRFTISVGSVSNTGSQSLFSESGSSLMVVAPSWGGAVGDLKITTTDRTGAGIGYTGDSTSACTDLFSGTSASAPIVSGIMALMLEINPHLTYRDFFHIISLKSTRIDSSDASWVVNGGGFAHSDKYGFGLVDAHSYTALAKQWIRVPMLEPELTSGTISLESVVIPQGPGAGQGQCVSVVLCARSIRIEHVEVDVVIKHSLRGQLHITVQSPSSPRHTVLLAPNPGPALDTHADLSYAFTSVQQWGEQSNGTWMVCVKDTVDDSHTGTWTSLKLTVYGTNPALWNGSYPIPSGYIFLRLPTPTPVPPSAVQPQSGDLIKLLTSWVAVMLYCVVVVSILAGIFVVVRIKVKKFESDADADADADATEIDGGDVVENAVDGKVEALFDFRGGGADQLSFEAGQIIHVTNVRHKKWWKGEVDGRSGIFPSNFVLTLSGIPPAAVLKRPALPTREQRM